jgi:hypothetical protein
MDVRCPHCDEPIIDIRRRGHGRPLGWVRPHPTKPDTAQAHCTACRKTWNLPNVRIVVFKAA